MNFYHTKSQLKTARPTGDLLVYCKETNSFYYYESNNPIPVDDHQVLITGNGGDTRWMSVHYTFNRQDSDGVNSIFNNMRTDTGIVRIDNRISSKELSKTIIFNTQFKSLVEVFAIKTTEYNISLPEYRSSAVSVTPNGLTGAIIHLTAATAAFQAGDFIISNWVAIGDY